MASPPPNLSPVWRGLLCDGETPVGVFARLRAQPGARHCFLLESVVGGERWARWSIIGVGHRAVVRGRWISGRLTVEIEAGPGFELPDRVRALAGDRGGYGEGGGGRLVEALLAHYRADPGESDPDTPRFWGGLVGVWGHDMVRDLERVPEPDWAQGPDLPAFELLITDTLVIFDNLSQKVRVVATACAEDDGGRARAEARAEARIEGVMDTLRSASGPALRPLVLDAAVESVEPPAPALAQPWAASVPFPDQVRRAKSYVTAGDVFQVVLSQRYDQDRAGVSPLDVYRMLRVTNPAPYMYLLDLPSATLAGASPEVMVRVEPGEAGRKLTLRPIAGTRRRGETRAEDLALERELLADPKERAEHLMLIDLGRNDVGRVAAAGSVKLEESFGIERYSKVMHIVSEVSGCLDPSFSVVDALRSTFPAGTLSGAPKVRAVQIIDELEPAPRGWYGGAVGYFGFDGAADFAICIRSVVFRGESVRVQAGAGLVYDSDPDAEDEECGRKASAVLRAIAMARAGCRDEPGQAGQARGRDPGGTRDD